MLTSKQQTGTRDGLTLSNLNTPALGIFFLGILMGIIRQSLLSLLLLILLFAQPKQQPLRAEGRGET